MRRSMETRLREIGVDDDAFHNGVSFGIVAHGTKNAAQTGRTVPAASTRPGQTVTCMHVKFKATASERRSRLGHSLVDVTTEEYGQ